MARILTIISLQFIVFLASCHAQNGIDSFKSGAFKLKSGESIPLSIVYNYRDQSKGLSGRKSSQFPLNSGMLFYYHTDDYRRFWMPDTYFDLDIFFLDKDFKIIDLERKVKAHPGMNTPPQIAQTRDIKCRHVLEMRSGDPLAAKLKIGTALTWGGKVSIKQIEDNLKILKKSVD